MLGVKPRGARQVELMRGSLGWVMEGRELKQVYM